VHSHNHCCHGKAVSIKYSECLSAVFVMQHAKCMHHITLSPVPIWIYHVLHYSINNTIFGKKLLNIKCVFTFSLQLLPEIFLILHRIQQDIIINIYIGLHVKYPLLSDFTELFHVDSQANRQTKLTVTFHNFARVVTN